MKNWLMFLLYLPWYNLFVILLQKMVVEFARSGIGLALEEMLVSFFFHFFLFVFLELLFIFLYYSVMEIAQRAQTHLN